MFDQLPTKMADIHNQPLFWVDDNERFWLQNPADGLPIHRYKLRADLAIGVIIGYK